MPYFPGSVSWSGILGALACSPEIGTRHGFDADVLLFEGLGGLTEAILHRLDQRGAEEVVDNRNILLGRCSSVSGPCRHSTDGPWRYCGRADDMGLSSTISLTCKEVFTHVHAYIRY
jgi:hypothetical protein